MLCQAACVLGIELPPCRQVVFLTELDAQPEKHSENGSYVSDLYTVNSELQ